MKMLIPGALFAIAAAIAPLSASAGAAVGGSIGSARADSADFEGSDTGWKAFIGGYGALLGGEIGYIDFGEIGGSGPKADAWTPALTLGVPVGGMSASIYGKLGVSFPEVEGAAFEDEFESEEAFYGVGVRAGAAQGLGFRVEYERFDFGGDDVDLASAGLELRF